MRVFKIFTYVVFCLLHIALFYGCLYLDKNKANDEVVGQVHNVISYMKYGAILMMVLLLVVVFLRIRDQWNSSRLIRKLTVSLNEVRARLFDYENPRKK